jgi:phospholipase C
MDRKLDAWLKSEEEIAARQTRMKFVKFRLLLFAVFVSAAAFGQIPYPNPINHVVIVYQENRSLDNLFGSNSPKNRYNLPGLDFSTTGKAYKIVNGVKTVFTVNSVPIPLASEVGSADSIDADDYDPDHAHKPAWLNACDAPSVTDPSTKCAMDGFNYVKVLCDSGATGCPGPAYPTYAYVRYKDVVPYFQIASQYGYANYMFQTNQGPSYPAHQFIFGGTSQPGVGSEPTWFVAENMVPVGVANNGCFSPSNVTVAQVDPANQTEISIYPCFTHTTLVDLFADHTPKITWTYYTPGEGGIWTAPNSISTLCSDNNGRCAGSYWPPCSPTVNGCIDINNPSDVLTDIGNCKLRQVNWVIPTALESDHAGSTDGSGPSWVASIVNKIGASPCTDVVHGKTLTYWQDTVILVTWDDWGGWYDHVVPPAVSARAPAVASSYVYGFRVPLLVVSAYTPAGTVDNTMGLDFGAILKFIEEVFGGLGTISSDPFNPYADYYAKDDLHGFFKFTQPARLFQAIQAPLKEQVFLDPTRPIDAPDND